MVFDDPLAITRAHVLSVPTDVYCLQLIWNPSLWNHQKLLQPASLDTTAPPWNIVPCTMKTEVLTFDLFSLIPDQPWLCWRRWRHGELTNWNAPGMSISRIILSCSQLWSVAFFEETFNESWRGLCLGRVAKWSPGICRVAPKSFVTGDLACCKGPQLMVVMVLWWTDMNGLVVQWNECLVNPGTNPLLRQEMKCLWKLFASMWSWPSTCHLHNTSYIFNTCQGLRWLSHFQWIHNHCNQCQIQIEVIKICFVPPGFFWGSHHSCHHTWESFDVEPTSCTCGTSRWNMSEKLCRRCRLLARPSQRLPPCWGLNWNPGWEQKNRDNDKTQKHVLCLLCLCLPPGLLQNWWNVSPNLELTMTKPMLKIWSDLQRAMLCWPTMIQPTSPMQWKERFAHEPFEVQLGSLYLMTYESCTWIPLDVPPTNQIWRTKLSQTLAYIYI